MTKYHFSNGLERYGRGSPAQANGHPSSAGPSALRGWSSASGPTNPGLRNLGWGMQHGQSKETPKNHTKHKFMIGGRHFRWFCVIQKKILKKHEIWNFGNVLLYKKNTFIPQKISTSHRSDKKRLKFWSQWKSGGNLLPLMAVLLSGHLLGRKWTFGAQACFFLLWPLWPIPNPCKQRISQLLLCVKLDLENNKWQNCRKLVWRNRNRTAKKQFGPLHRLRAWVWCRWPFRVKPLLLLLWPRSHPSMRPCCGQNFCQWPGITHNIICIIW